MKNLNFSPYNRFITSQFIARTIDWIDIIALNWITLQLTGSPIYIAYINFARLMPQLLFALVIGKLVDSVHSTKLMYIVHFSNMFFTVLIMYAFTHAWDIYIILFILMVRSFFQAIDTVQRNTLIQAFVAPQKVHKAISLNALILNISRLIGPLLSGILLAQLSNQIILLLPFIGSIFVILLNQRLPETCLHKEKKHHIWSYLKQAPIINMLILSSVCSMIFGFSYTIILPGIVDRQFGNQTMVYAVFTAMIATGSIIILIIFMRLNNNASIAQLKVWGILFIFSIFLLMWVESTYLYAAILILMGLSSQAFRTTNRILVQQHVDDQYRGSVLSISMMDKGFIPLGGILLSFLFQHFSLNIVYLTMIAGLLLSLISVYIMQKKEHQYGTN